ncbi:Uncharacterised protein [Vibrio cholerae]|nr:Uncharacterised protein [Vibrio cholerae]CSI50984.1 Uncharacterised protein [Vibrio cholerae]
MRRYESAHFAVELSDLSRQRRSPYPRYANPVGYWYRC